MNTGRGNREAGLKTQVFLDIGKAMETEAKLTSSWIFG